MEPWEGSHPLPRSGSAGRSPATPRDHGTLGGFHPLPRSGSAGRSPATPTRSWEPGGFPSLPRLAPRAKPGLRQRDHGNPGRVPIPSRALAPPGEARLRQRDHGNLEEFQTSRDGERPGRGRRPRGAGRLVRSQVPAKPARAELGGSPRVMALPFFHLAAVVLDAAMKLTPHPCRTSIFAAALALPLLLPPERAHAASPAPAAAAPSAAPTPATPAGTARPTAKKASAAARTSPCTSQGSGLRGVVASPDVDLPRRAGSKETCKYHFKSRG